MRADFRLARCSADQRLSDKAWGEEQEERRCPAAGHHHHHHHHHDDDHDHHTFRFNNDLKLAEKLADSLEHRLGVGSPNASKYYDTSPFAYNHDVYVQTQDGAATLPGGHTAVVDNAGSSSISGGQNEMVPIGRGNQDFATSSGAGTIMAGDGSDNIKLGGNTGDWHVALGNGIDSIALGGAGKTGLSLGHGADTVDIGGPGATTIFAGTSLAQSGRPSFHGAGHDTGQDNAISAGSDNSTLRGSAGMETWSQNGASSLSGGGTGHDVFVVQQSSDANLTIVDFMPGDQVLLSGYTQADLNAALAKQTASTKGVSITLSDHTTITFADMDKVPAGSLQITPNFHG